MTDLQRIENLEHPPIAGEWYLVPTVRGVWLGKEQAWPVIGPRHNDKVDFNFDTFHYHVDGRFLSVSLQRRLFSQPLSDARPPSFAPPAAHTIHSHPLCEIKNVNDALPDPVWRRRRCVIARIEYPFGDRVPVKALRQKWANMPARRDQDGALLCPHRKVPLGNIAPDPDGLITCPLHGLRIDPEKAICAPAGGHP